MNGWWIAIWVSIMTAKSLFAHDVERWRDQVAAVFPIAAVATFLCIIDGESEGDPDAVFDEWAYWWGQHPTVDGPPPDMRPPAWSIFRGGGDSRYSVGLAQMNVGNLALTRIAGLNGWTPPVMPPPWRWEWPPAPTARLSIEQAHMILLVPENNISASHRVFVYQNMSFLHAWTADKTKCELA